MGIVPQNTSMVVVALIQVQGQACQTSTKQTTSTALFFSDVATYAGLYGSDLFNFVEVGQT